MKIVYDSLNNNKMKTEKENIEPILHKTIDDRRKMLHTW